ncbi:ABC transporter permease [Micromonospora cathayae]|uniref:ABC transporter permease subunit n=1 Tax=Micromonospora cathayae TaxID=3028804 RepID=A0ABY7ZMR5_9ACTN|nr:ABC transporter permease subunit [Micromonospora sp. HUAS 3]WDZ83378.1 ABC transporter permease subunit [Micromonospora sp. HUAS 3]
MTVTHPVGAEEVAIRSGPPSPPPDRPSATDRWTRLTRPLPALLLVGLLTAGWQLMAETSGSALIPGLGEIADNLAEITVSGALWENVQVTLVRVGLGFAVAFVVSVAAGIAMGRSAWLRRFLEPAVLIGLATPGLVKALLCVIWFGVSLLNPILTVALAAAPALTINVAQGVRAVDPALGEMAHIYRFDALTRLRYVWIPAIVPDLFTGARLGIAMAWKVIVLVEIFGLADGVGYQLNLEFSQHNVAGVLAWTIAFALVMAIIEYGLLQTAERRAVRWRRVAAR